MIFKKNKYITRIALRLGTLFFVINNFAHAGTYIVTNATDGTTTDGVSLRWAITQANSNANSSIFFDLGVGPTSIAITTALPAITATGLTIDGFNNGANSGTVNTIPVANSSTLTPLDANYKVILNFSTGLGLTISGNNNTIKGLVIPTVGNLTPYTAINITGSNNQILGCYIGMNINGKVQGGLNMKVGVQITGGANNSIGNGTAAGANLIAGLVGSAAGSLIAINQSTATGNTIKGNLLGLQKDGTTFVTNGGVSAFYGISIQLNAGTGNIIGGTNFGEGNIISGLSGSASSGIYLNNLVGATQILGNVIGPAASTQQVVAGGDGTQYTGIFLEGSSNNIIGGTTDGVRNIITGNNYAGIFTNNNSSNPGSTNNRIEGNYIGSSSTLVSYTFTQDYGVYFGGVNNNSNKIGGVGLKANYITCSYYASVVMGSPTNLYNSVSRNAMYNTLASNSLMALGAISANYTSTITITNVNTHLIEGTATTNGDTVEVFKTDPGGVNRNAHQFISAGVVSGGVWSVPANGLLNAGDKVIVNARNVNGNTSKLSTASCPAISVTPSATICSGFSQVLAATGASTYIWRPSTFLSATVGASVTSIPASTITYTLTGNCGNYIKTTISVGALPIIDAGNDTIICRGESRILGVNNSATSTCINEPIVYNWFPITGLNAIDALNPIATPDTTTTYYLSAWISTGRVGIDSVKITVLPIPPLTVTADSVNIIQGQITNLTATGSGAFNWTPNKWLSSNVTSTPVVTPDSSITYQVTLTSAAGCVNQQEVSINVFPFPFVSVNSALSIAEGSSVELIATTNATNITWTPTTGLSNPNGASTFASPTENTAYTVKATIRNTTVQATTNVNVFKNTPPLFTFNYPNYPNREVAFSAMPSGVAGETYLWDFGDGTTSTAPGSLHDYPNNDATYHVCLTTSNISFGIKTRCEDITVAPSSSAGCAGTGQ